MKISTLLNRENRGVVATVLVILLLLPVAASMVGFVFSGRGDVPEVYLERVDPAAGECVEDPEYMRFYHMDYLKDLRTEVIREGLSGAVTLSGCGECHRSRDQFCNKCHEAATVILDCWGCHFYPETAEGWDVEEGGDDHG